MTSGVGVAGTSSLESKKVYVDVLSKQLPRERTLMAADFPTSSRVRDRGIGGNLTT